MFTGAEGEKKYAVKMDVNNDGYADKVIFNDEKTAVYFKECHVDGSQKAACQRWMYEQAKETDFDSHVDRIDFYRNGEKYNTTNWVSWSSGLYEIKGALCRLWSNLMNSTLTDRAEVEAKLLKLFAGGFKDDDVKGFIKSTLAVANKRDSEQKLNDEQVEFVADLIWRNRFSIFNGTEFTLKSQFPIDVTKIAFDAMSSTFFSDLDYEETGRYRYSCISDPDPNMGGDDLVKIHKLFGKFAYDYEN